MVLLRGGGDAIIIDCTVRRTDSDDIPNPGYAILIDSTVRRADLDNIPSGTTLLLTGGAGPFTHSGRLGRDSEENVLLHTLHEKVHTVLPHTLPPADVAEGHGQQLPVLRVRAAVLANFHTLGTPSNQSFHRRLHREAYRREKTRVGCNPIHPNPSGNR